METLDNLTALAAEADAGAIAADPVAMAEAAAAPPPVDFGREADQAVDLFCALLCGFAPKCEAIWTNPAKARTSKALAPVLEKYGITMDALPPELTLAIVAGPLLWQSSKLVAAQLQELRQAAPVDATVREANPAPEAGQAPAAPVHDQVKLYS